MDISVLASGSGGNCSLVSAGGSHILVDAGISMKRINCSLQSLGLSLDEISGVFITHEHSDHISALKMLLKHYDMDVYAPRTLANRLRGMLPDIEERLRLINVGADFFVGGIKARAFHTPHDTDESVGYRFNCGGSFAIATDMGKVTDEILDALIGADAVLIESNHDLNMLRYGPYPFALKKRILSERGHLSNDDCARLARTLAENGTRQIVLGHLSRENNRPELALQTCGQALEGLDVSLHCAPPLGIVRLSI